MSRSTIKNYLSVDEILSMTDNGRLVFERELGYIPTKAINSPLRTDKNPSFVIFQNKNGIFCFKDFSTGESGSAITFIERKYNYSFTKALEYIYKNLNCKNKDIISVSQNKPKKKDLLLEYSITKFTPKHKAYFDQYGLPESFLNENGVYAIDKYAINKKVIKIPNNQYCFVYEAKDIGKCKILTLGEEVVKKWINTANNDYLWLKDSIKNCETLFIVKSLKDALVLKYHFGLCAVAVQNESAQILLENNYDFLENAAKTKVVNFGTDFQGWHESYLITYLTGWSYFNIPNSLYDNYQIEDPSDYIANFSVKSLGNLLKIKGYL